MKLKPSCFEDVIAAGALYRPGPLDSGMVDVFINRKHGREKVTYPHPALEPVLKDTYGVIVYQEQVMQISPGAGRLLAGPRRPAPPRDGQEEGRGDGRRSARLPRGLREEQRRPEGRRRDLRPDGEVRRVRLQQVALGRLRPDHHPDRVAQGALPGRVHGRAAHQREGQHRQGGGPHRRGARRRASRCCRPTSTSPTWPSARWTGRSASAWAPSRAWARARSRRSSRRARQGPFKDLFDFCERVDSAPGEQEGARGAGEGGRVRLREAAPPAAVRDD